MAYDSALLSDAHSSAFGSRPQDLSCQGKSRVGRPWRL